MTWDVHLYGLFTALCWVEGHPYLAAWSAACAVGGLVGNYYRDRAQRASEVSARRLVSLVSLAERDIKGQGAR